MKKIFSLILVFAFMLLPVSAFAAEIPAEALTMMGDVDNNGKVNASDARFALRISASLESSEEISLLAVDADGSGMITSADARLILRYSASLSSFDKGFDGKGTPNSFKVLKGDTFGLSVKYEDISFDIIKNGRDIKLYGMDMGDEFGGLNMDDCGIMYVSDMLYMIFKVDGKNAAMYIPAELYEQFEISNDYLDEVIDGITGVLPDDCGVPQKIQNESGKTVFLYTVDYENGGKLEIYCDEYGVIEVLKSYQEADSVPEVIEFLSINSEIPQNSFDLSGYELM